VRKEPVIRGSHKHDPGVLWGCSSNSLKEFSEKMIRKSFSAFGNIKKRKGIETGRLQQENYYKKEKFQVFEEKYAKLQFKKERNVQEKESNVSEEQISDLDFKSMKEKMDCLFKRRLKMKLSKFKDKKEIIALTKSKSEMENGKVLLTRFLIEIRFKIEITSSCHKSTQVMNKCESKGIGKNGNIRIRGKNLNFRRWIEVLFPQIESANQNSEGFIRVESKSGFGEMIIIVRDIIEKSYSFKEKKKIFCWFDCEHVFGKR
jgi:hypothetical protein